MQFLNEAFRLVNELRKFGEIVSGSRREEKIVKYILDKLQSYADEVKIHGFNATMWIDNGSQLYVKNKSKEELIKAAALPYTPRSLVEGNMVYVREFGIRESKVDVEGKIVLTEWAKDPDEAEHQYLEAIEHGALGLVLIDNYPSRLRRIVVKGTYGYSYNPSIPPPIPALGIRYEDGLKLRKMISTDSVSVEIETNVKIDFEAEGKTVEAIFNGSCEKEKILITAHHDHWFSGVSDDLLGVAFLLWEAEKLKRQKLLREVRIISFGAEECGAPYFTEWYWSYGSRWYVKNVALKYGLDTIYAIYNWDVVGKGEIVISASGFEYLKFLSKKVNHVFLELDNPYFDSYSFSSLGLPSATINTIRNVMDIYHTDKDILENLDSNTIKEALTLSHKIIHNLISEKHVLDASINVKVLEKILESEIRKGNIKPHVLMKYRNLMEKYDVRDLSMAITSELIKPIHEGDYRTSYSPLVQKFLPEYIYLRKCISHVRKILTTISEGFFDNVITILKNIPSEVIISGEEKVVPLIRVKPLMKHLELGNRDVVHRSLADLLKCLEKRTSTNLERIPEILEERLRKIWRSL